MKDAIQALKTTNLLDIYADKLAGAELKGGDFRGAVVVAKDFTGANLEGSDMRNACLARCAFRETKLTAVNFESAILFDGRLENTDFCRANLLHATLCEVALLT